MLPSYVGAEARLRLFARANKKLLVLRPVYVLPT